MRFDGPHPKAEADQPVLPLYNGPGKWTDYERKRIGY
jgi:hypothetical protein